MTNKNLIHHIKKRLEHGDDIKSIRDELVKRGFPYYDVHESIDIAFSQFEFKEKKEQPSKKSLIEELLKPSKSKMILPIIILFFLLMYFFGNVSYLPDIGKKLCINAKLNVELEQSLQQNATNIDEVQSLVWEQQTTLIHSFKNLLFYNFPLVASKAYRFNPFFPAPCELTEFSYTPYCNYYLAKQDYDCMQLYDGASTQKPITDIFGGYIPEFKPISVANLLFHSLILLLEYYLIGCVVLYAYKKSRDKMSEKKKESLHIAIVVGIVLVLILAIIAYVYLLSLISVKLG